MDTGQFPDIVHSVDAFEILGWELIESSGTNTSTVLNIWKKSTFPPAAGDAICSSGKPTLSVSKNAYSVDLSGWTTSEIAKGDYLTVTAESNNSGKALGLILYLRRR